MQSPLLKMPMYKHPAILHAENVPSRVHKAPYLFDLAGVVQWQNGSFPSCAEFRIIHSVPFGLLIYASKTVRAEPAAGLMNCLMRRIG